MIAAAVEQLESIGVLLRPELRGALQSLWPAPLTAVLPLEHAIAASRGVASIAARVPNVLWLRSLLEMTGPLASTSANRSGEPPIGSPDQLPRALRDRIDGIVDSGTLPGEPSTIVDFTGNKPRIVREGNPFFTQQVWKSLRKTR